uniref:Uncharacterized protein n=1 Tax=Caenorhabditis tropicalis TaxID=1561998 RepID=A0A1I7U0G6_9PELO
MLDEDEIQCYRQALDLNSEYVQLIYNRDYALRGCIQNLRQQSVCRMNDKSRLRACLCGVREQYDSEVQSGILQCVKSKSPHIPAMVIEMSSSLDSEPSSSSKIQEQVTPAQLTFDTPGAIVNGQCMCACESGKTGATRSFLQKQQEEKENEKTKEVPEEVVEMETVKDEQPPKTNAVRFKENSPRLMQPSEAAGRVFWMNNITII